MPKTLMLKGTEKVRESSLSHLCNHNNCWKYIKPGDKYIEDSGRTYTIHVACAENWCNANGIEARYL